MAKTKAKKEQPQEKAPGTEIKKQDPVTYEKPFSVVTIFLLDKGMENVTFDAKVTKSNVELNDRLSDPGTIKLPVDPVDPGEGVGNFLRDCISKSAGLTIHPGEVDPSWLHLKGIQAVNYEKPVKYASKYPHLDKIKKTKKAKS